MKSVLSLTLIVILVTRSSPLAAQSTPAFSGIKPGDEVRVTPNGSRSFDAYFVSGDSSAVTVLDLRSPKIGRQARELLLKIAMEQPTYFTQTAKSDEFVRE